MAPILDRLLFFKKLFIIVLALNVLCIVTGLVLGISHWQHKRHWEDQSEKSFQKINQLHKVQKEVQTLVFQKTEKKRDPFETWSHWFILKTELVKMEAFKNFPLDELWKAQKQEVSLDFLKKLSPLVQEVLISENENLNKATKIVFESRTELIWVTGLTLIFGVLLPLFLFWFLGRMAKTAKKELENKVSQWTREWVESRNKYGGEAFKNPEFWTEVALLSVEQWAPLGKHPAFYYISELSCLIRKELQKPELNKDIPSSAAA